MSPGEAYRQMMQLLEDPTSRVAIAMGEIERPISREEMLLMDLHDLLHQRYAKRGTFKPYPRPWKDRDKRSFGNAAGRTRDQVIKILNRFGHNFKVEGGDV